MDRVRCQDKFCGALNWSKGKKRGCHKSVAPSRHPTWMQARTTSNSPVSVRLKSMAEARHGLFAWSTSLRRSVERDNMFGAPSGTRRSVSLGSLRDCLRMPSVQNTSRVSQTQEESVKSHEEPASVHSWIPACEAGLAICRARGRTSVHDRG